MRLYGFGVSFELDLPAPLAGWVRQDLEWLDSTTSSAGSAVVSIRVRRDATGWYVEDEHVSHWAASLAATRQSLYQAIERALLSSTYDYIFLHAAVASWHRRRYVFPGASMAGKTTLSRALHGMGSTVFSDEYAVLDWAGKIHPFRRPLGLRRRNAT